MWYVNEYTGLYIYEQLMLYLFMRLCKDVRKNNFFYYSRFIMTYVIPLYKFRRNLNMAKLLLEEI